MCFRTVFVGINFLLFVGVYVLSVVWLVCPCSVITDVLWLNLSRTAVLGAGVNRNTYKYRQHETPSTEPISFQKKNCLLFPGGF